MKLRAIGFSLSLLAIVPLAHGSALEGERYRVIISSDIGGSDADDIQSFIHYLVYADLFDTEGLISSPPHDGRKADFLKYIDVYEKDYPQLRKHSERYPSPDDLRGMTKQGHTETAPEAGYRESTEGSDWIIECARRDDPRPLYVLVWGSITDVAQAVHDAPEIKEKIRVYFIASWNYRQDPHAAEYLREEHPDLWMIYCDTTFRGWYVGGEQSDDLGNRAFIQQHIDDHGALGKAFAPLKSGAIKMGDTPSVAYLLWGDPSDPTTPSWGGRFAPVAGHPQWWTDLTDPALKSGRYDGAKTVNRWREDYLRDWQQRMDRLVEAP